MGMLLKLKFKIKNCPEGRKRAGASLDRTEVLKEVKVIKWIVENRLDLKTFC